MLRSISASFRGSSLFCLLILASCTQARHLGNVGDTCVSNSDCASLNCVSGTCQAADVSGQIDKNLIADVRPKQLVAATGQLVQLYGGWSTVLASKKLTYTWTLSTPEGSTAVLSDPSAESPTFTVDKPGRYVAMLTVSDGEKRSEVSAMEVTAYEPETEDVHLIAALFPPLAVGDFSLYQTAHKTIERRVENSQALQGETHFRLIPTVYGDEGSNPLALPATEAPMLVSHSPTGGRKMRALEFFEQQSFLADPPLIIVPHALKLGVPTTHWAKTKVVDNQQEIYLQLQSTVTLVAIEPCSLQSGTSFDVCYKIQREMELITPLASGSSEPRSRYRSVEWLVDGLGVVKIQLEVAEMPRPPETPVTPGQSRTVAGTYDPTAPVEWKAKDVPGELIYYEIGGLQFGDLPPLSVMLDELSAELAPTIDGSRLDWANITPLGLDLKDQTSTIPGSDLKSVSFALDPDGLSILLTFHNGGPQASMGYFTAIDVSPADPDSLPDPSQAEWLAIRLSYFSGIWKCTAQAFSDPTEYPGEIAAGDDFIELRFPRSGLIQKVFQQGVKVRVVHSGYNGPNADNDDSLELPSVIAIPGVGR